MNTLTALEKIKDIARSFYLEETINEHQMDFYILVVLQELVESVGKSSHNDVLLMFASALIAGKSTKLDAELISQPQFAYDILNAADFFTKIAEADFLVTKPPTQDSSTSE